MTLEHLGVIEGFYGRPWTVQQRLRLFSQMALWGMNTYLYAPKDDLWHRSRWRDLYPAAERAALAALRADAHAHGLRFVYALAPGLDLDWSSAAERQALTNKLLSLAELGVTDFALLFDDIPTQKDRAAQANEQVEAVHLALHLLPSLQSGGQLIFCPTEYCGEFAVPEVRTSPYLQTLGRRLDPRVLVCWTGPKIVSPEISVTSVREASRVLGRRLVLWDNLHASDYTSHRLHLGPYGGRSLRLRQEVAGVLSNPNTPFEPNFPGLFSLAEYATASAGWTAAASGRRALAAWLPEFGAVTRQNGAVTRSDLALLADTLFLPHQLGPLAQTLLNAARTLSEQPGNSAARRQVSLGRRRFLRILRALEAGKNRDLLYDLHPYLVDVIEELSRLIEEAERPTSQRYPYRGGLADHLLTLGWPQSDPGRTENRASMEISLKTASR